MGEYSEVTIVAPDSAEVGDQVQVQVRVYNKWTGLLHLTVTGHVDGVDLFFGNVSRWVSPGQTNAWYDSFIMPGKDVRLTVTSWFEAGDGKWYVDDREYKDIDKAEPAPATFSDLVCSYGRA